MSFVREHAFGAFVLAAVLVSFFAGNAESSKRDHAQHIQIVQTCVRGSGRIALIANGQFVLARRVGHRAGPGDRESSEEYAATGNSLLGTLPAPSGLEGSKALAEVHPVYAGPASQHIVRYQLTRRAVALQQAGCERANP